MANQKTDAAAKLRKLGERVRQNWAKRHPMPEQQMESVRKSIREQWNQERTIESSVKNPQRKPPELER